MLVGNRYEKIEDLTLFQMLYDDETVVEVGYVKNEYEDAFWIKSTANTNSGFHTDRVDTSEIIAVIKRWACKLEFYMMSGCYIEQKENYKCECKFIKDGLQRLWYERGEFEIEAVLKVAEQIIEEIK